MKSFKTKPVVIWCEITILVALCVVARFVPHPPNFSPFAALALFCGATIANRPWALATPLLTLLLSDSILGLYAGWPTVYLAIAVSAALGLCMPPHPAPKFIVGFSLLSALSFFIITNLGVWAMADLYPQTHTGLTACFVAALPFFQNTVFSTLLFSTLFFALKRLRAPQITRLQKL